MWETIDGIAQKYGWKAIVPVSAMGILVGGIIWFLSDHYAQPGTPVSVLWGMAGYVKNGVAGDACKSVQGRWVRDFDNAKMRLTQDGCLVVGVFESSNTNGEEINLAVYKDIGRGYVRRIFNGCQTILSVDYELINDNALRVKAAGSGCDLKNYTEDFVYNRIVGTSSGDPKNGR